MKEVFVIEIARELSEEEIKFLEKATNQQRDAILKQHEQKLINYFTNEGIEEKDIKELDIYFVD